MFFLNFIKKKIKIKLNLKLKLVALKMENVIKEFINYLFDYVINFI